VRPNANSYRRLRPLSYAPTAPTWGYHNRTVALGIPTGSPAARRIEHRVAGADANPYLALAVVLAGIHHGLSADAPIAGTPMSRSRRACR
jgi:glutamine synthetase